jgi:hypothetical protein
MVHTENEEEGATQRLYEEVVQTPVSPLRTTDRSASMFAVSIKVGTDDLAMKSENDSVL